MAYQADTARVAVRFVDELYDITGAARGGGAWGTVPSDALITMRISGESLKHNKKTVTSPEIRPDRQTPLSAQVGVSAQGDVNWALSADGQFIPLFAGALLANNSDWVTPNVVTGASNISFAASGKTITSGGTPSFNTKYKVGQYIQVKATTNNGTSGTPKYFRITNVTATVITVADTVVDEPNTSAVITGSMIRNGVAERSFTLERQATDLSNVFISYGGMELDGLDLTATAEQIITGKFSWMGKKGQSGSATVGTGAPSVTGTDPEMNATTDVGSIMEGSTLGPLATALKSIQMTLKNNLRARPAVGVLGSVSVGKGACNITGKVEAYFSDLSLYAKFETHTTTALHWRVSDANGKWWFFTLPAVKFSTDDVAAGSPNQDLMEPLGFEAGIDPTTGCMIQMDRF